MKIEKGDAEAFNRRGQSGCSPSSKKRRKNSTRRRMLRNMNSEVRRYHRRNKATEAQLMHRVCGDEMPYQPAIAKDKRLDFMQWFTSILPKKKDEASPTTNLDTIAVQAKVRAAKDRKAK